MIKRALISVFYKEGILDFAKFLRKHDVEIIATGGTLKYFLENGVECTKVEDVTGFKEMMDGRVKTLNPYIHGGILCMRDKEEHLNQAKEMGIGLIDLVVVNLYPFFLKSQSDITEEEKVEFIDIGGPTMLRSAAKNFKFVSSVCDPEDYKKIMEEIEASNDTTLETRKILAGKVFNLTSAYDAAVSNFLLEDSMEFPPYLSLSYKKNNNLSYGENPHQKASLYIKTSLQNGPAYEKLNGKDLSYNNIKDMDIAYKVACDFKETVCCAVKHNTPCGVAVGTDSYDAYKKAFSCDEVSIFGGVIALNTAVSKEAAEEMVKTFLELIIAPDFTEEALEILRTKKNLRVIKCSKKPEDKIEVHSVMDGILVQEIDRKEDCDINVVTKKSPNAEDLKQLQFAMKVVKYVKSNAIVIVKDYMAIGIGGGQVNRINAAKEALVNAKERMETLKLNNDTPLVMASDAFFPFDDVVLEAEKYGVTSIIQPGGSIRDKLSVAACDEHDISMVFTGVRHFKH